MVCEGADRSAGYGGVDSNAAEGHAWWAQIQQTGMHVRVATFAEGRVRGLN